MSFYDLILIAINTTNPFQTGDYCHYIGPTHTVKCDGIYVSALRTISKWINIHWINIVITCKKINFRLRLS